MQPNVSAQARAPSHVACSALLGTQPSGSGLALCLSRVRIGEALGDKAYALTLG